MMQMQLRRQLRRQLKRQLKRQLRKWLGAILSILWLVPALAQDSQTTTVTTPILARWAFWVPAARLAEFAEVYEAQIVPVLTRHGFIASDHRLERVIPEGVFSRLFDVAMRAEFDAQKEAILADELWLELLDQLGARFGRVGLDGRMRNEVQLYSLPAGKGKRVPAGPGTRVPVGPGQGHWRTFGVRDGLAGLDIQNIIQDRAGNMWFTSYSGGTNRYDGQQFTTFTRRDGLAGLFLWRMLEDRLGHLWFSSAYPRIENRGISRYDGQKFTTYTTAEGLPHNSIQQIVEDRQGHLWFASEAGLGRYDGQRFTTNTTAEGLAHNKVWSVLEDQAGTLWIGTQAGISRRVGPGRFTVEDVLRGKWVTDIYQMRSGSLWFFTGEEGWARYDGREWTVFSVDEEGLPRAFVLAVLEDRRGRLWVALPRA